MAVTAGAVRPAAYAISQGLFSITTCSTCSPKGLPAVVFEKKLIDSASKSVLYAAVVADSLEQAAALERQIDQPEHRRQRGLDDPLSARVIRPPSWRSIGAIKDELSSIHFAEPDHEPGQYSGVEPDACFTPRVTSAWRHARREKAGETNLTEQLRSLRKAIGESAPALANDNPARPRRTPDRLSTGLVQRHPADV